ncbi:GtrA family protein [Haloferacaceae archaeon DSL9]
MSDLLDDLANRQRIGKFVSVGTAGATVDLTLSSALVIGAGLSPEAAKVVGAEVAIVLMFFINDRWTFSAAGKDGRWNTLRRLLRSNFVRSGGLAVQFVVVYVLTRLPIVVVVAGADIWALLTFPLAIACSSIVNYVAESLFTWRVAA